jgi:hypothetical protein
VAGFDFTVTRYWNSLHDADLGLVSCSCAQDSNYRLTFRTPRVSYIFDPPRSAGNRSSSTIAS